MIIACTFIRQLADGPHYELNYLNPTVKPVQKYSFSKRISHAMFVKCEAYQEDFLVPEVNEVIAEQHERLNKRATIQEAKILKFSL